MPNEFWLLAPAAVAVAIVVLRILARQGGSQHGLTQQAITVYERLISANASFMRLVQPLELSSIDPFAVPKAYRQFREVVQEARAAINAMMEPDDTDARRLWEALREYLAVFEGTLLSSYGAIVQTLKSGTSPGDALIQVSIQILVGADPEKKAREALESALKACGA